MKRKIVLASALCLLFNLAHAQGEMDAIKLSQNDLTGTARSVAMGGAFGALGGDISGIAINPAGIGVYKSSEIVTTLNFQNVNTETEFNIGKVTDKKFKFNFDNLAFVTSLPLYNDDVPLFNIGFSYNRLKNFDRQYKMSGDNVQSLSNYMAHRTNGIKPPVVDPDNEFLINGNNYDAFYDSNLDWLAILGHNGYLISQDIGNPGTYNPVRNNINGSINSDLFVREKGSISSYDFNFGTTISDIVSLGATLSVTDIDYHRYTSYEEAFVEHEGANGVNGFRLENDLKTEGAGFQAKVGVIVKPIQELRFGVSYHSPTWYNMTDYFGAALNSDVTEVVNDGKTYTSNFDSGYDHYYDYKFRSPDKWTFSLAGVIGQTAIISADYEYTNYKNNMKLLDDNNNDLGANSLIKEDFRGASTVRVGAEVRFTPQFSGRVGYAWMQSPLEADFREGRKEVWTVGSDSQFLLDGDIHHITYGVGYRFTRNFYTDIAFVMKTQKSDLYSFSSTYNNAGNAVIKADKVDMKTNTFQGLLTLGYKF